MRPEAVQEADHVGQIVKNLSNSVHKILTWQGDKPAARIQEEARKARYGLMAEYCAAQGIAHLFLAHHADDQAETVLFRLAKGSGLDGLGGMRAAQNYNDDLTLIRPLLNIEKSRLIATCRHHDLAAIDDPTNFCTDYARPRLRAAREVLEEEGLSTKRLATTAYRLQRARAALDDVTDIVFRDAQSSGSDDGALQLDWAILQTQPEEIALRVIIQSIQSLKPDADYLPRMEKIEALLYDLFHEESFRKRTLGGLVFARDDKTQMLLIKGER